MKLITLNIWGGYLKQEILNFFNNYQEIDIFCLQEVYCKADKKISTCDLKLSLDIFTEIQDELPNHIGYFRPVVNDIYGIAMLVHKDIHIIAEGEICIHENNDYPGAGPTHQRNMQWLKAKHQDHTFSIFNVHGLWNGKGKLDSTNRINQARRIKEFTDSINMPKIICGDFNLRPETESIKIVSSEMNDLIQKYNITSTRTSHYPKEERFADYVFTSNGIHINDFKVLEDEVSDHAALALDFTV